MSYKQSSENAFKKRKKEKASENTAKNKSLGVFIYRKSYGLMVEITKVPVYWYQFNKE